MAFNNYDLRENSDAYINRPTGPSQTYSSDLQRSIDSFGSPAWINGNQQQQGNLLQTYQNAYSQPGAIGNNNYAPGFDAGFGQQEIIPGQGATGGGGEKSLWEKISNGTFGTLQGWGQLLGGAGDVAGAYMAYKQYGQAKDQFATETAFANRNLANQAVVTNNQLERQNAARYRGNPRNPGPVQVNGSAIV